jgi:GNAT superfamily N-acetyltransferase
MHRCDAVGMDTLPRRTPRHARRQTQQLADGRTLWLRPVAAADAGPIAGAFTLLGEDEVRRRYLHPMKALGHDYLQQLVAPLPGVACAYVAAEPLPPGEALVGAVARATRIERSDEAEFAILVSRFVAGQGLGRALMLRVFEWARAHGIRRIHGDVIDDNAAMLALAQSLGFRRDPGRHIPGLLHLVADVGEKRRVPSAVGRLP